MTADDGADDASDDEAGNGSEDAVRSGEFGIADDVVRSQHEDHASEPDPTAGDDEDTDDSAFEEGDANTDAPLGSLASSVEERRRRSSEGPDDSLFDEESVPEIDTDVVWQRIDDDHDEPPELPGESDPDVRVIEKRSYCEQCPFFSEPPDVACGHDGTEILELVDMEHFRVVDCPKVLENERLERL